MRTGAPFTSVSQIAVEDQLVEWAFCRGCVGGLSGTRDRVVADYLRHHLVMLASGDSHDGMARPVHIQRLRMSVRRQLSVMSDWFLDDGVPPAVRALEDDDASEPDQEIDKRCLETLVQLSEVVPTGGGYYLPTPLRAVRLHSGGALLIGGPSARMIVGRQDTAVQWAGFARCLADSVEVPSTVPFQSLNRWLELTEESLSDWTENMLAQATSDSHGAGSAPEEVTFDVYDPDVSTLQHRRWVAASHWAGDVPTPDSLWLCRSHERPRRYWLAHLYRSSTSLNFSSVYDVPARHSRRLMYGLDQRVSRPVEVRTRADTSNRSWLISLSSWPTPELYRLLLALGYPREQQTVEGHRFYLPLRFEVADEWWPDVRHSIEALGMRITSGNEHS